MQLPLPDRRIRADDFFTRYLPELWRTVTSRTPLQNVQGEVLVQIRNQRGAQRDYSMNLQGGELTGVINAPVCPLYTVFCDLDSWRGFHTGVLPQLLRLGNDHLNQLEDVVVTLSQLDSVGGFAPHLQVPPGMIEIQYTDDAGDLLVAEVQLGDGKGPRATLQIGESVLFNLVGKTSLIAGLLTNDVTISGDAGYAIKVAQHLQPPDGAPAP